MVNAATAEAALERQQQRQQMPHMLQQQQLQQQEFNNSITELLLGRQRGRGQRVGGRRGRRKFWDNIKFPQGEWEWGGCSDNVNFGLRHSRAFLDAKQRQRRSDLGTLVKLHNNNAGRLVRNAERERSVDMAEVEENQMGRCKDLSMKIFTDFEDLILSW